MSKAASSRQPPTSIMSEVRPFKHEYDSLDETFTPLLTCGLSSQRAEHWLTPVEMVNKVEGARSNFCTKELDAPSLTATPVVASAKCGSLASTVCGHRYIKDKLGGGGESQDRVSE